MSQQDTNNTSGTKSTNSINTAAKSPQPAFLGWCMRLWKGGGCALFLLAVSWLALSFQPSRAEAQVPAPALPVSGSSVGSSGVPLGVSQQALSLDLLVGLHIVSRSAVGGGLSLLETTSLVLPNVFALSALVPAIGNAVVMGRYSARVKRAWGMVGVIAGGAGLATTGVMSLVLLTSNNEGATGQWALMTLPLLLVSTTNLVLGSINLARASRLRKFSLAPYITPEKKGGFAAGATLSFSI